MTYAGATFLAFIQGISEFLPISSSAHLIFIGHWIYGHDQGLAFDVAVHFGSLLAVIIYFFNDLRTLFFAWINNIFLKGNSADAKLAWLLILATLPAAVIGILTRHLIATSMRSTLIIATSSIFFGLLLFFIDKAAKKQKEINNLRVKDALLIGLSQAIALIPGTSRSGITMTAGLWRGLSRKAAARFSFLLSVPTILGASLVEGYTLTQSTGHTPLTIIVWGVLISAVSAWCCIHLFINTIDRIGFTPFVIYRIFLGVVLLLL